MRERGETVICFGQIKKHGGLYKKGKKRRESKLVFKFALSAEFCLVPRILPSYVALISESPHFPRSNISAPILPLQAPYVYFPNPPSGRPPFFFLSSFLLSGARNRELPRCKVLPFSFSFCI